MNTQPTKEGPSASVSQVVAGTTVEEDVGHSDPLHRPNLMFLVIFLVLFPLVPIFISLIFGAVLAWAEDASFSMGFFYVVSNLLGLATPLTDFNPNNTIGVVIDVYVSMVALLAFGIVMNVVTIFQTPLRVNEFINRFVQGKVLTPLLALGLVIPFSGVLTAVFFGVVLGLAEDWGVHDGIFYVFSNILGLGTPLTDVVPTSLPGKIFDIIISSMALGTAAIFVDYVTELDPALYIRKKTKAWLKHNKPRSSRVKPSIQHDQ